jgi:hypothetical protein
MKQMMICVMLFAWFCNPVASVADPFPQLIYTGKKRPAACAHALQFAKAAFNSGAFLLYAPIRVPPNLVYEPKRFADAKETTASEDYTFAVPANLPRS